MRYSGKSLLIVAPFIIAASWFLWKAYTRYSPDHYDITEPLDLTAPPTFVTELKLRIGGEEVCFAALADAGVRLERLPDEEKGEGCEFKNVAQLEQSTISWGGGVTLRCPMLAGLYMWERHHLQPAAEEMLGVRIIRVEHYGSYSCRNINNAKRGARSQHAFANAVDLAGFVLENGDEVSVANDWGNAGDKGKFLKRIRDNACKRFNTVLGPDYNALHNDHFHFDNGPSSVCR
ncbi:MAG: extensin family protein [Marinicaulis sp.]|nr:extensin family protein [Marinicaulis sp.]